MHTKAEIEKQALEDPMKLADKMLNIDFIQTIPLMAFHSTISNKQVLQFLLPSLKRHLFADRMATINEERQLKLFLDKTDRPLYIKLL